MEKTGNTMSLGDQFIVRLHGDRGSLNHHLEVEVFQFLHDGRRHVEEGPLSASEDNILRVLVLQLLNILLCDARPMGGACKSETKSEYDDYEDLNKTS